MNVNEETAALIAEARRWANGHPNRRSSELMRALADALESRQPGENDREVLAKQLRDIGAVRKVDQDCSCQDCEGAAEWVNAPLSVVLDHFKTNVSDAEPTHLVCAWCPQPARGDAWHNDGKLHPSCGQIDHGQGWVPPYTPRAAVPDAAPTLCVECNEVEVLGKPEHLVLCMDCAYETGRAAVPNAASEAKQPEGWSTEDRREAKCEAERRWSRPVVREADYQRQSGTINGFILGAEWQKARETFISYRAIADEARAERDAALAAIERCRGVLSAWESRQERNREILGNGALGHFQAIDCTGDLRTALDGAPEPEWEVQYGRRNRETGALHWLTGDPRDDWWHENQDRYEHVKRYTSPPLPVEGEKP